MAKQPRTNAQIRALYKKAAFLAASGVSSALKATMMLGGRRSGYLTRVLKLQRRVPAQLKGVNARQSLTDMGE